MNDANAQTHAHSRRAERLVVAGFRSWMEGYDTGELACWEAAFNVFADELGPDQAKTVIVALSRWVRNLRSAANRPIRCFAAACPAYCRDECAALALISACQEGDERQARAAAFALTGVAAAVDELVGTAGAFADALSETGCRLNASLECRMSCVAGIAATVARPH